MTTIRRLSQMASIASDKPRMKPESGEKKFMIASEAWCRVWKDRLGYPDDTPGPVLSGCCVCLSFDGAGEDAFDDVFLA
ncbi:hypothetical protein QRX46_08540, partial [Bifidobacterium sp. H1HS10N]|uniref:hypothetical protein n=1 Tax=Bifidobacterium kimbladii TaxID=1293826 RepID=UPI0028BE9C0C